MPSESVNYYSAMGGAAAQSLGSAPATRPGSPKGTGMGSPQPSLPAPTMANVASTPPGSPEMVAVVTLQSFQCNKQDQKKSLLGSSSSATSIDELLQNFRLVEKTGAHLSKANVVRALEAARSMAEFVSRPPESDKHAMVQQVVKQVQRQVQLMQVLADDWSLTLPRCTMPAPELLQHVEALVAWFAQIHAALQSQKRYMSRVFTSRSKVQEQFQVFDRVLSEHGGALSDSLQPPQARTPRPQSPARRTISDITQATRAMSLGDNERAPIDLAVAQSTPQLLFNNPFTCQAPAPAPAAAHNPFADSSAWQTMLDRQTSTAQRTTSLPLAPAPAPAAPAAPAPQAVSVPDLIMF